MQIDDDTDEDLMAVLLDPQFPEGFSLLNCETMPPNYSNFGVQLIYIVKQGTISMVSHHPNRQLAAIFRDLYDELRFFLRHFFPCTVIGLEVEVQIPRHQDVRISVTGMAIGKHVDPTSLPFLRSIPTILPRPFGSRKGTLSRRPSLENPLTLLMNGPCGIENFYSRIIEPGNDVFQMDELRGSAIETLNIEVSSLSFVPGTRTLRTIGRLCLHFVKECSTTAYPWLFNHSNHSADHHVSSGDPYAMHLSGMGTFMHIFGAECLAMIKAHVAALGGNALVAFRFENMIAVDGSGRGEGGYGLASLSGDVIECK